MSYAIVSLVSLVLGGALALTVTIKAKKSIEKLKNEERRLKKKVSGLERELACHEDEEEIYLRLV